MRLILSQRRDSRRRRFLQFGWPFLVGALSASFAVLFPPAHSTAATRAAGVKSPDRSALPFAEPPNLDGMQKALSTEVDVAGRFTSSYQLQVPAFHGIEPALLLQYDSQATNGPVGVGW